MDIWETHSNKRFNRTNKVESKLRSEIGRRNWNIKKYLYYANWFSAVPRRRRRHRRCLMRRAANIDWEQSPREMSSRISSATFFICGAGGVWERCNRSPRALTSTSAKARTEKCSHPNHRLSQHARLTYGRPVTSTFHSQFEYFTCSNEVPINILKLCSRKLNKFQFRPQTSEITNFN